MAYHSFHVRGRNREFVGREFFEKLNERQHTQCILELAGPHQIRRPPSHRITHQDFSSYFCRKFFSWPSRLVYAKAGDLESGFTRLVSYSPFRSGLDLDYSGARYTGLVTARGAITGGINEVTIVARKPMAYLLRDFDLPSVRMSDFLIDDGVYFIPTR